MQTSQTDTHAQKPLGIGIVGAGAGAGWAKVSHIPAINALEQVKLIAVAASSLKSAQDAAKSLGLSEAYASVAELAESPEVDLVTVSVRVPAHRGMVLDTLKAGKHVLCEWPLALDVEDAEMLAAAARQAEVHAAVGLQTRDNPAARRARRAIAEGRIGRPLTAVMLATTAAHGAETTKTYAYLCDPANGANLSTILAGHAFDLIFFLLGGMEGVNAMGAIQYPEVRLTDARPDEPGTVRRTTPDFLAVQARMRSGCIVSAALDGARKEDDTPFELRITGTGGSLVLRGGNEVGFQAGELTLEATVPLPPEEPPAAPGLHGPPVNLSEAYAALAGDIRDGKASVAGFEHAVRLHRFLRALANAVRTGETQKADDWPVS